jgi:hypothetical protein
MRDSPVLAARLFGGLGNQMFIYAAARRLALVSGARLALDTVTGFATDTRYQRRFVLQGCQLPSQVVASMNSVRPPCGAERRIYRSLNRCIPSSWRWWISEARDGFDPEFLALRVRGTVWLEGYWQDERYFTDMAEQIRRELTPQPPTDEESTKYLRLIKESDGIAVHLRLVDAPGCGLGHDSLATYYRHAMRRAREAAPHSPWFVFSDDPATAAVFLESTGEQFVVVQRSNPDLYSLADMWLMTRCRALVLAPSTFSWWAAWLASDRNIVVFAPSTTKGWRFDRLIQNNWQAVPMQ